MLTIINHTFIPISCLLVFTAIFFSMIRIKYPSFLQNNKEQDIPINIYRIIFCLLLMAALVLRLYHLKTNPIGINCDDAGTAYDAFCIANYGTDRFGFPFPVYFINYSVGQNALYAYLLAPLIKIFGTSVTIYRLPSVLGGMMTLFFGMKLMKDAYGKKASLITGFLITICPFFIMSSRRGLECMILLGFVLASIYTLSFAIKTQKYRYFVLSGLLFGLCLYCYSLAWIILPVFLLLTIIYLFIMKKINWKQLFSFAVPMFIFALPLFLFIYINTFEKDSIVTPFFSILNLPYYRTGEFGLKYGLEIFSRLKTLLTSDILNFFSYKEYGTLYLFSIPFIILGFVLVTIRCIQSIRKKVYDVTIILYFYFAASLVIVMFLKEVNLNRSNSIFYSFAFFLTVGILYVIRQLHFKKIILVLLSFMYLINFVSFADFYYTNKVRDKYPVVWFDFDYTLEIYEYLHEHNITRDVYFDEFNVTTYCVGLLEYEVSPEDYMAEGNNISSDYCHYKNQYYYLPEPDQIDPEAIYIVMNYNTDFEQYRDVCMSLNMDQVAYGYYTIFYPQVVSEENEYNGLVTEASSDQYPTVTEYRDDYTMLNIDGNNNNDDSISVISSLAVYPDLEDTLKTTIQIHLGSEKELLLSVPVSGTISHL